ncbi:hypothetical protein BS78_08G148800 [Paspalum vaginatum]|nr:hypothetical protein BS78_08G148800 [Paspalum vaginatum]
MLRARRKLRRARGAGARPVVSSVLGREEAVWQQFPRTSCGQARRWRGRPTRSRSPTRASIRRCGGGEAHGRSAARERDRSRQMQRPVAGQVRRARHAASETEPLLCFDDRRCLQQRPWTTTRARTASSLASAPSIAGVSFEANSSSLLLGP